MRIFNQNILLSKTPSYIVKGHNVFYLVIKSMSMCGLTGTAIIFTDNKEICSKIRTNRKYSFSEVSFTRSLFQFGNNQTTRKEYAGRKLVGYVLLRYSHLFEKRHENKCYFDYGSYSSTEMFDVVSDVQHYYTFVPFCKKSEILSKSTNNLKANLIIGFPPVIESYTSHVTLVKPHLVKAVCTDGKLFNHLLTTWKFTSGLKNNPRSCIIDFYVSFDFNSPLYSHLANIFFNELVRQMESAFYEEAKSRYGEPSMKTIKLRI